MNKFNKLDEIKIKVFESFVIISYLYKRRITQSNQFINIQFLSRFLINKFIIFIQGDNMIKFSTNLLRNLYRNVKPANLVFISKLNFAGIKPNQSPLITKLEDQIKYEQQNPPDLTQQNQLLLKIGWKLERNGTLNQLTKKNGNNTVHVVYFSRSPIPESSNPEEKNPQQQQSEKMPDYCEFTVYIKKANQENYLFGDFVISDGELTLLAVNFTNDYLGHRILNKLSRSTTVYAGPDLETLEQDLINGFHQYFEQNGINDELITFIQQNSLDSEQELYVNWLKDIRKFVQ